MHDPFISGPLDPAALHDPLISDLHDPAVSVAHSPNLSDLHDPIVSGAHDPAISDVHNPNLSGAHNPIVSGGHDLVDSDVHSAFDSSLGSDPDGPPPDFDFDDLFGNLGVAALGPVELRAAQVPVSETLLSDELALSLGLQPGARLVDLGAVGAVILPDDFEFTDGWDAPPVARSSTPPTA